MWSLIDQRQTEEHRFHQHVQVPNLHFQMNGVHVDVHWVAKVPSDQVWHYGRHSHNSMELHIVPEGECSLWVDGKDEPVVVGGGQLYLIPPGIAHAQKSSASRPALEYGLNCSLRMDAAAQLNHAEEAAWFQYVQSCREVRVAQDTYRVAECFQRIFREAGERGLGYRLAIQLQIYQILIGSIRALAEQSGSAAAEGKREREDTRIRRIDQIIRSRLSGNLTLRELSELVFMSERQLARTVLQARNLSVHQYILELKLEKAIVELATERKIHEIADSLGFSSSQHFTRLFKRKYGLLPSEYQQLQTDKIG
ncbi:AraC family transcriptional regulator [Cohnella sp. 56]|uniref:AraC family transcriptional regulator n=1 Tax=Cohnella sp. 56 TaxID=3113722 RepID=UPI0030E954A2